MSEEIGTGNTRRRFIGGAATGAAAAAATGGLSGLALPAGAQASPDHIRGGAFPRGNWRIDTHAHYYPQAYYDYLERIGQLASNLQVIGPWSLPEHLKFMDRYKIKTTVFSHGDIQASVGDVTDRRQTASAVNDYGANLVESDPARFGALALTSMPDLSGTIDEVKRALDVLKMDGVCMLTNYQGIYVGNRTYDPLYKELNDRNAFVFVHPTGPQVNPTPQLTYGNNVPSLNFVYEYTFDSTRAITSLIYNGVIEDYPNIRWQFAHAGGTIPFLALRLGTLHGFFPPFAQTLQEGPYKALASLYYDTAQAFTPAQIEPLRQLVPLSHILFGSDWPPVHNLYEQDAEQRLPFLKGQLPNYNTGDPEPALSKILSKKERILIERNNALKLFPRLRARSHSHK